MYKCDIGESRSFFFKTNFLNTIGFFWVFVSGAIVFYPVQIKPKPIQTRPYKPDRTRYKPDRCTWQYSATSRPSRHWWRQKQTFVRKMRVGARLWIGLRSTTTIHRSQRKCCSVTARSGALSYRRRQGASARGCR